MEEPAFIPTDEQKRARVAELRAELDGLGYHVVKKDWIRKFGSLTAVVEQDRFHPRWETAIRPHVIRRLCQEIGIALVQSGAIKVEEETNAVTGYSMRAQVSIVLRDPQFDKPVWFEKTK